MCVCACVCVCVCVQLMPWFVSRCPYAARQGRAYGHLVGERNTTNRLWPFDLDSVTMLVWCWASHHWSHCTSFRSFSTFFRTSSSVIYFRPAILRNELQLNVMLPLLKEPRPHLKEGICDRCIMGDLCDLFKYCDSMMKDSLMSVSLKPVWRSCLCHHFCTELTNYNYSNDCN